MLYMIVGEPASAGFFVITEHVEIRGGRMRLRNLSRWTLSLQTQGLLFFAQRIDELLFDFSLDAYKPPALNSPYLCREAIELISEIEKEFIEPSNLEPVLEELVWSVRQDAVAKSLLDSDIEYYTLHNNKTPLSVTKLRLEVLDRTINSGRYIEELRRRLIVAVRENDKGAIDFLATSLVTSLINGGVSKQWLHEQTHEYFFSPSGVNIDSEDLVLGYLDLVVQKVHKYTVFCVVSDLIKSINDSLDSFHLKLLEEIPDEMLPALSSNPLRAGEVVVQVAEVVARDPHAAREVALRKLDNLSDLFTLFYHRKKIEWRDEVLVKWECCDRSSVQCRASRGAMERAFDLGESRAAKELGEMIAKFAAKRDRDSFNRFNRVADLHGICVSHDIPENQLVNLWTALETLVPSRIGGSKIKQVVAGIIPFTGIAYIRSIFERLLSDLLVWDKWRTKKILNKVSLPRSTPLLQRLAVLIVAPECSALREELYGRLGDFHLLRYRCFSLSRSMGSPKSIISRLEQHELKVRWQIRRLYRARNLIVHTSRSPSYIKMLIENGHDYLDAVIFEVIRRSCSDYQAITIEQSFELTAVSYDCLKREIKRSVDFSGNKGLILVGKTGIS